MTQEGEHDHGAKPRKATTANVNHCLRRLQHELEKGEITSIALPRLGTGVGGLDWGGSPSVDSEPFGRSEDSCLRLHKLPAGRPSGGTWIMICT